MNKRLVLWSGLGVTALLATIGGAWLLSLPPAPAVGAAPPIAQEEADATIAALKPPKRQRPLIAIIGVMHWDARHNREAFQFTERRSSLRARSP
jgi:hypothetical protein